MGPNVDALEREFEERLGRPVAALASGTAAIHLGLRLLGVSPSDEVVCSTLTFVATANPILYLGARPVFIDSSESTWNMDPSLLAEALDRRARRGRLPRAVIVVHLYGQSADMAPILDVCRAYGVPVLEDAAESLGALYDGRPAGTLGDVGVFSLNGNKIITASGGGLLVAPERRSIERVKRWAAQAREPGIGYEHRELGHNYGMSNVLAGIAGGQLTVLDDRIRRRREIAFAYQAAFSDLEGIALMPQCQYGLHTNWLSAFAIDEGAFGATRDDVLAALRAANIEARPVWKPLHLQPLFGDAEAMGGRVAEDLHRGGLCLPSSSSLTPEEQDAVVQTVRSVFRSGRSRPRVRATPESTAAAVRRAGAGRPALVSGQTASSTLEEYVETLLGRAPIAIGGSALAPGYDGRKVLITGAGGTIGGELARQVTRLRVRRVLLFDRSENDLCRIDVDVRSGVTDVDVVPIAGDVLDTGTLREVFREFRPDLVLHAAASKHVALMERHPTTAIRNNVFGTCNVAALARRHAAESCVLISTDKAVNPTSVMGVSKRIAELVFLGEAGARGTRFRVVRLGNVLSSNGSVVPLFQQQIAERRPLTVTDTQATRYFITVGEAAQLVLAAALPQMAGEFFLLNMHDPIRILDLAHALMDMAGFTPDRYLPIQITGLRPGEKRHEHLLFRQETVEPTAQPHILRVRGPVPQARTLRRGIRALHVACDRRDLAALGESIRALVPEFQPSSAFETLVQTGRVTTHGRISAPLLAGRGGHRRVAPTGDVPHDPFALLDGDHPVPVDRRQ